MKGIKENSIDSVVTDPPAGISFMGKSWDDDKGGRDEWIKWLTEVMRECNRVLKPGAHALVWAIPRTSHWTATAIENAGFEIRDVVTHLFGSGFPKSLDVSKAIDKAAGAEREIVGKNPNGRVTQQSPGQYVTVSYNPLTNPSTDEAKQWAGWGTALKPASEHWILARKPLSEKTVAKNVLKWGTGALNIDASRVSSESMPKPCTNQNIKNNSYAANLGRERDTVYTPSVSGRFPANLVLSCDCKGSEHGQLCAIHLLDEQGRGYGRSAGGGDTKAKNDSTNMFGKNATAIMGVNNYNDKGSVSRFFYCAKVSSKERGEGNTHPTVKASKLMVYLIKLITPPNGTVLDPFMGSGSTGIAAKREGFKFVGIEREQDYYEIAGKRLETIELAQEQPEVPISI